MRSIPLSYPFPPGDAMKEIKRANREDNLDIVPITVKELLEHERVVV